MAKPVICINNGMIFDTIVAASKYANVHDNCIRGVLNPNKEFCKTAGVDPITGERLQWAYYEPNKEYKLLQIERGIKPKPIICNETGTVYESIKEAGEQLGISYSGINHCLNGFCKTAHGYTFKWANI